MVDAAKLIKSRIAGRGQNQPNLSDSIWRYVSIITGQNAQRDRINEMGYKCFASGFNQPITYFYSNDSFGREDDPDNLDTCVHQRNRKQGIEYSIHV